MFGMISLLDYPMVITHLLLQGYLSGRGRNKEWQLLELVRETKILLLDEATSALDSESEALVQKHWKRLNSAGPHS